MGSCALGARACAAVDRLDDLLRHVSGAVEKSLRAGAPPSEEALEALEELRPHLEHSEAAEALDRLADHMDNFDLDKSADAVNEIAVTLSIRIVEE